MLMTFANARSFSFPPLQSKASPVCSSLSVTALPSLIDISPTTQLVIGAFIIFGFGGDVVAVDVGGSLRTGGRLGFWTGPRLVFCRATTITLTDKFAMTFGLPGLTLLKKAVRRVFPTALAYALVFGIFLSGAMVKSMRLHKHSFQLVYVVPGKSSTYV